MEKERSRKSISSSVEKEETCQEGKVFFTFQSAWANPKKVQFSLDEPYCRLSQWLFLIFSKGVIALKQPAE